jgi:TPR repeat protein
MKKLLIVLSIVLWFWGINSCSRCCKDVWNKSFDTQALECCKEKAQQGSAEAQYDYGLWLIRLPETNRNVSEGIEWLIKSAKNKYPVAQVAIGMFLSGQHPDSGIKEDMIEAYAWLSTAQQYSAMAEVEKKMSAADLLKAKKRASEYIVEFTSSDIKRIN